MRTRGFRLLCILAVALFIVWCGWNLFWLSRGQPPSALFRALTGLPAPTTGGTRAGKALLAGDWRESLRWNPLAVPE